MEILYDFPQEEHQRKVLLWKGKVQKVPPAGDKIRHKQTACSLLAIRIETLQKFHPAFLANDFTREEGNKKEIRLSPVFPNKGKDSKVRMAQNGSGGSCSRASRPFA